MMASSTSVNAQAIHLIQTMIRNTTQQQPGNRGSVIQLNASPGAVVSPQLPPAG